MTPIPQLDMHAAHDWTPDGDGPLIISGPCSAESEEQVLATARAVAAVPGVKMFRAGIWKPRTRPNSFEGVGVPALQWLRRVKEETGLMTTVEVANGTHVYEALKHGIDVLWIGARTTVNPFSVQEIANALRGVDVPVLVKNPINPDLQLWIGALERLNAAGIKRLGAIHRGFSTYEKTAYRNAPKWNLAIELRSQAPDILMICDPSHIGGSRAVIPAIAQRALDIAMDGLMIETHVDPDNALSDAGQQLTPEALAELLAGLHHRRPAGDLENPEALLADLRGEIDAADYELLEVLQRRANVVRAIAELKRDHKMTILQVSRWKQLLEDRLQRARRMGLEATFVKEVYQIIHDRSIKAQSAIMNEAPERAMADDTPEGDGDAAPRQAVGN